jgi:hypothetical protein
LNVDFTILGDCVHGSLAEAVGIKCMQIVSENEDRLTKEFYPDSRLYGALLSLNPDVLVVDLFWMMPHHFINELPFKKILLARQVSDSFFSFKTNLQSMAINTQDYDFIFATEPYKSSVPMRSINPLIIRNKNEILPRKQAFNKLGIEDTGKTCLLAVNGVEGEFRNARQTYSYLEDEGYNMVYSTNYKDGLFPAVDYFNAFDLVICGAGYNAFWEVIYFDKESIFIPVPRRFESQYQRVAECQEYYFEENGADQLADIIMGM